MCSEFKIVLATGNLKKVAEMDDLLAGMPVDILAVADFPELEMPEETGDTFLENALLKARAVAAATRLPSLADDSGLAVDALGGRPGIYSARYAGENCSYDDNNRKLLQEMQDVPEGKRTARFITVMALVLPDGEEMTTEGICEGVITTALRGDYGFGYDPLFIPEGYEATFAELGPEIKNIISHRARALRRMAALIEDLLAGC